MGAVPWFLQTSQQEGLTPLSLSQGVMNTSKLLLKFCVIGMMRAARPFQAALVVLLVATAASLAHAQQSNKRAPYACFYDECSTSKAKPSSNSGFEACLKEGVCRPQFIWR